jgi:hypothetical protein
VAHVVNGRLLAAEALDLSQNSSAGIWDGQLAIGQVLFLPI